MARIRTLKPEFWDSPSTAQADLAVRLTFMAMWNWADDSGHGTANVKELEAFVFPNDEVTELPRRGSRNSGAVWPNFAAVLHEVAEVYGVVFYKVKGRPYYRIPSFNEHQAKHYRKDSRYPQPEEGEIIDVTSGYAISSTGQAEAQDPVNVGSSRNSGASSRDSGLGTGEQGNRGTGIVAESDDSDDGPSKPDKNDRDDIRSVLDHLDQKLQEYDPEARLPNRTQANLDAARLLLDRDSRTVDQVKAAIDYSQDSEFWRPNIRSMSKLRDKYETLRAQAQSTGQRNGTTQPQPTGSLLWDDEARKKAHERPSYLTDTDHI